MTGIINGDKVSKERLITAICLIMILEHDKLGLGDVVNATGMDFDQIRNSLQNLVNLRLIKVIPTSSGIPEFKLIDAGEAKSYLKILGVDAPEAEINADV